VAARGGHAITILRLDQGDGNARSRWDRVGTILVHAGLAGIAAFVAYFWTARGSSDLTWDEAFNFRVYARSPVTALALYNEHNNHPLESFVKSVFYCVLSLDEPAALRITGFLFVAGWLALAWALFSRVRRGGDLAAATALVLLMLLVRAFSYQAMELRGYFLSSLLQLLWLFLLVRDGDVGAPGPPWSRRTVVRYAALSALIAFTLPSNVLVLPALWALTVAWRREPGVGAATALRRAAWLGAASVALTAALYAPILLGFVLGWSRFHNSEARTVPDALAAAGHELALAVEQLAPRGVPVAAWGWAVGGLLVAGAVAAARGRAAARVGLLVIGVTMVARVAFAAVVGYPDRVRTALVAPLAIGVFLLIHAFTASWSPRLQRLASLALILASFACVPSLVSESGVYRVPTEIAAFLETYLAGSREVLIVHDNLQDPLVPVGRSFGPARVVSSRAEMAARFRGERPEARHAPGTWQRRLRDWILPEEPWFPMDAAKVGALVVIDDETRADKQASRWRDPVLEGIKERLPRRSEFRRGEYRMLIFEGSGGR
jgi:hypothetical protein